MLPDSRQGRGAFVDTGVGFGVGVGVDSVVGTAVGDAVGALVGSAVGAAVGLGSTDGAGEDVTNPANLGSPADPP